MIAWGWRGVANLDEVRRVLLAIAQRRGLEPAQDAARGSIVLHIACESDSDGVVVTGRSIAGPELAAELSRTLASAGRYAEVDLEDTSVAASAYDIAADGTRSADEDLDELVQELCNEWFEDRKYLAEAHYDLVGACLGLDRDLPDGHELVLRRVGGKRVGALLDAIRAGAQWERTSVGGRAAVRVVEATGSRISVLTEDELAEFLAGVASST
ncbi:MAG TPA: hypothetical protein VG755_38060 [Nannocystaceae bacterium]|nr:hypothetical protein [Nannocystaceae bacterium]